MIKTIIYVVLVVIGGKVIGFAREMVLASGFGASRIIDEFLMAESIMVVFFGWLSSFAVVFTPVYKRICVNKGKIAGNNYTSMLLFFVESLCVVFILCCLYFDEYLLCYCAPGFLPDEKTVVLKFFYVIVWSQVFIVINTICSAYLSCNELKVTSSISNLLFGSAYFAGVLVAYKYSNEIYLAWGVLLAYACQAMFVLIVCKKNGLSIYFDKCYYAEIVNSVKLTIPVFVSTTISDVNVFFDKMFASLLNEGVVSVLHYASRIQILFSYVFSMLVQTVFFPDLSELAAADKKEDFKEYLQNAIEYIFIFFLPLTVSCIILAEPVVRFVYAGGKFDQVAILKTTETFICYSIGLLPIALKDLFVRSLYSLGHTSYSFYVETIAVTINVFFNYCFYEQFQHMGLAFASSISVLISVVIYGVVTCRIVGNFFSMSLIIDLAKSALSTIVLGVSLCFANIRMISMMPDGGRLDWFCVLVANMMAGLGIYIFGCVLLKVYKVSTLLKKGYKYVCKVQ